MKKNINYIIVVLLFFVGCQNQQQKPVPFQERMRLFYKDNNIKSISIYEFQYSFGKPSGAGELVKLQIFNRDGEKTKEYLYIDKDTNDAGAKYYFSYSHHKLKSSLEYVYTDYTLPYSKALYYYDSLTQNISYMVCYDYPNGSPASKSIYFYNKQNLSEIRVNGSIDKTFFYDADNKLTISTEYRTFLSSDFSEFVRDKLTWYYFYNAGSIKEAITYNRNKIPFLLRRYEYLFFEK